MTLLIWLIVVVIGSLVVYFMRDSGLLPDNAFPRTRPERHRRLWVAICAANFVAFILHGVRDRTSALFGTAREVDGHYLVVEHGTEVSMTPGNYWFSYWHGVIFIIVALVCMFAIWRLKKKLPANLLSVEASQAIPRFEGLCPGCFRLQSLSISYD